jgi:hypothetical protein
VILAEVAHPRGQRNADDRDQQAYAVDSRREAGAEREPRQDLELNALPAGSLVGGGDGEAAEGDAQCAQADILPL